MKSVIKKFLYDILSLLNIIIPKQKRVFINSGEKLYDNNEAIFKYLLENTNFDIVCTSSTKRNFVLRDGVKIIKYSHITAAYYLLTSSVIIDSFLRAIKVKPSKNQISIQLWHGTGLKKGCYNNISDYYTHIASSSDYFVNIVKKVFSTNMSKIFINGNPRNDLLVQPFLGKYSKKYNEKYIIWLPTYRNGLGRKESSIELPVLNLNNCDTFNSCLMRNNVKLFIKPHPLQSNSFNSVVSNKSNIILINDQMLIEEDIMLYQFIGGMDALLTDYSSVFYDYLLLDRPIGFVIEDIDEYKHNRGFVFDNPLSMMPGMKIYNIDDLENFISNLDKHDPYKEDRRKINELANFYKDNKNCERILDLIKTKM